MKNVIWVLVFVVLIGVFVGIGVLRKGGTQGARQIGVIPKETASVYWEGVRQGARKAGAEEKYDILWNGPEIETDRERQIQIIEDMIARKVTGIVLAPNDRKALVPAVEKIAAKEIPCVIIDSGVETDKFLSFMATDNYKGGVLAAQRLGEVLGGKGRIIIVEWTPNSASTDYRVQGFRATMAQEFPGITIVDSKYANPPTMQNIQDVTQDMLLKNTNIDGVFACNATTAGGALQALRDLQKGDKKIKMVGFDAWPMLVEGLEKGDLDGLIIQNPYKMGYEGVKAIIRHLQGESVPKQVDTGVELITQERLRDPRIKELLASQI